MNTGMKVHMGQNKDFEKREFISNSTLLLTPQKSYRLQHQFLISESLKEACRRTETFTVYMCVFKSIS